MGILGPVPPVPRPTPAVSNGKDHDFRREFLLHNAEGKLPEGVFSEVPEVVWPALGSIPDSLYCLLEGAFKVNCCNRAALAIPSQRSQILLFRLGMKAKRPTCHAAVYVPFAGPLPKRSFLLCQIERHAGGGRFLAARRRLRLDQRWRPNWRSSFRLAPPVRSQAVPRPFAAVRGHLES